MNKKKIQVIPSIDLIEGICIRLSQGNYDHKEVYDQDPLNVSLFFQDIGISRIHLVDLDGAKSGKIVHWNILEKISNNTNLSIDFSGGIQNYEDIRIIFECGANIISLGSIAVKKKQIINKLIKKYGKEKIYLGMDVKNNYIAINGWKNITNINFFNFLKEKISIGIKYFLCTDISKDGLLAGPSLQFYKDILMHYPKTNIIASGGISNLMDIQALKHIGCYGVILGKIIYENKMIISKLRKFIKKC